MSVGRGAKLVAAGILLSRVAGLLREQAISLVLGGGPATDAFRFAMRLPNFLQNLLGEGSLSASFVPVYAGLIEKGKRDEANQVASAVVTLLAVVVALIVLAIVLLARPIVGLFSSFSEVQFDLAVNLLRITTLGIGFLVLAAWCLGILNSHRHFFLSYVSPVIWNVAQIVALVAAGIIGLTTFDAAVALAVAMVVGSGLQFAVQLPRVLHLISDIRLTLEQTAPVRDVVERFLPAVGARGVLQVSSFVDTALAAILLIGGGLSWFVFAQTIYLLPISLFGFSIAVSELTEMSRQSESHDVLYDRVVGALRRVAVPAGFVTAAYIVASRPLVDALYGWPSRLFPNVGQFDASSVTAVAFVVAAFGTGLPAAISARIVQNTLYAMGDVKGPARIAVVRLIVGVAVGTVAMIQLDAATATDTGVANYSRVGDTELFQQARDYLTGTASPKKTPEQPHLGAVGLAFGASAAAWTEFVLLRRRLASQLGRRARTSWLIKLSIATLASGTIMYLADKVEVASPFDAVGTVAVGAATYAASLKALGINPIAFLRG